MVNGILSALHTPFDYIDIDCNFLRNVLLSDVYDRCGEKMWKFGRSCSL